MAIGGQLVQMGSWRELAGPVRSYDSSQQEFRRRDFTYRRRELLQAARAVCYSMANWGQRMSFLIATPGFGALMGDQHHYGHWRPEAPRARGVVHDAKAAIAAKVVVLQRGDHRDLRELRAEYPALSARVPVFHEEFVRASCSAARRVCGHPLGLREEIVYELRGPRCCLT